jgi:hypothetical protein
MPQRKSKTAAGTRQPGGLTATDWVRHEVSRCDPGPEPQLGSGSLRIELPPYARVVRELGVGVHPYLRILPGVLGSPAMVRIVHDGAGAPALVSGARVRVSRERGFAYVDDEAGEIVLAESYYAKGSPLDLYLDLLHELAHLRQLAEGRNLWDESFAYPNRPTEIEAYAVAVEEGRRLGMTDSEIIEYLTSPCLSAADVQELYASVMRVLGIPRWARVTARRILLSLVL